MSEDEVVRRILQYDTWAVVGLGDDPSKPAYGVAAFLASQGKRIVPVHPRATQALGQTVYRTLADIPFPVDVVDVFRVSSQAGRFADEAVAVGAHAVWFQLAITDDAAYERTVLAGLLMVMNRCPKIDWPVYGPV